MILSEEARVRALKKFSIDAANTPGEIRLIVDSSGEAAAGILFEDYHDVIRPTVRNFHFFITHEFWRHGTVEDLSMLLHLPAGVVVAYGVQEWDELGKLKKPGVVRLALFLGMHIASCKEGVLIYYTSDSIPKILARWETRRARSGDVLNTKLTYGGSSQSPLGESQGCGEGRSLTHHPEDPE